jgi:dTDP-4-amino-4,6-dideoxygalactose transaminase/predicted dehydrogenase
MPGANRIVSKTKRISKDLVKKAIGLLPPPSSRLTGNLAKNGGKPVRDMRFRPWKWHPSPTALEWTRGLGPTMRRIFRTAKEGLPQELAERFAREWAAYCGAQYALLLPHGTDALRFGLAAALDHDGFEYGGEVIVPNLTFVASASSALDRRLGVALVDVDPATLNVDPDRVEEAIIPGRTRAIMAVHLFGQPADMSRLKEIASRHSLALIEDAAQAHGALHEMGRVGSIGDAAAFSFQSSKNLSSGEGGALTTSDPAIFERAYSLHNVGRARIGTQRWGHETLGWNCRASEYVAAVLLHRMQTLEKEQQQRYARFLSLRQQLEDVPCVEPLAIGPGVLRHAAYMFVMRYRREHCGGLEISDFLKALAAEGMPAYRAYETTLAQQPALRHLIEKHPDYVRVLPTPVADQAVNDIVYLPHPIFLGSEKDITEVAAAFRKVQAFYDARAVSALRPAVVQRAGTHTRASSVNQNGASRPIRFGIIGIGAMGQQHAAAIQRNPRASLVSVSDVQTKAGREAASRLGCKWVSDAESLMHSGEVDAVVIATPHWEHPRFAVAALHTGLHVVCEKPIAVTVADADDILKAAALSPGKFAAVHQTRFEPVYQYAKQLLDSGELGDIYRCSMVESAWRTEAYYQSSPWRGTWRGEGGGVLLNQAPHLLDRYAWLCGMPMTISARCDTNLHHIEVEDTASAILRHPNGAHGYIHISTVECPAISRTVISCDRGRVTIEDGKLRVTKLRDSIRDKTANDKRLMGELESENYDVNISQLSFKDQLNAFYDNFAAAIDGQATMVCPGEEGRNAVELVNAMLLSSAAHRAVSIPLDREEYTRFMQEKVSLRAQVV